MSIDVGQSTATARAPLDEPSSGNLHSMQADYTARWALEWWRELEKTMCSTRGPLNGLVEPKQNAPLEWQANIVFHLSIARRALKRSNPETIA